MPNITTISHVNNFDFLRLLFATFVIITHSYALTGLKEEDILFQLSKGQASLSGVGVFGFFTISGYLITKSMMRSDTLINYYFKRVIRVFPALWLLIIITSIICIFLSGKSLVDYFNHYSGRDYLFFNLILKTQYTIDGVFSNNPYKNFVNGSLWTIPYEFFCYIALSLVFIYRKNLRIMRFAILATFITFLLMQYFFLNQLKQFNPVPFFNLALEAVVRNTLFFLGGAMWSLFPLPSVRVRKSIILISILVTITTLLLDRIYYYAQFFLIPILIIPFGTLNLKGLSWIRKYGDYSYGVYLWAFFIQQLLMYFFRLNYIQLMLLAIPLAYLIGAVSWHLIEKNALKLKLDVTYLIQRTV